MLKNTIVLDEENHIYRVDGKIVPSVTQLLPKQDYFVSDEKLEECAADGSANHAAVKEMLDTGVSTCGYTDAVKQFIEDMKDIIGDLLIYETPMYSPDGFAGTPDMVFKNAIVDLKRSSGNIKIHALQLAGYQLLATQNNVIEPTKQHYILIANEDGTYSISNVYHQYAIQTFKSLITKHKIDKSVEYYLKSI